MISKGLGIAKYTYLAVLRWAGTKWPLTRTTVLLLSPELEYGLVLVFSVQARPTDIGSQPLRKSFVAY